MAVLTTSKRRKAVKSIIIAAAAALFILFVNLCDSGALPEIIKKPVDALNELSGGLLYHPTETKSGLNVYFIDVGQGDSELITCDGKAMLIDAGTPENGNKVKNFIRSKGIEKIDYLVCTHPHNDHIGGMEDVIENIAVKTVLMPDADATSQTYENLLLAIKNKNIEAREPENGSVLKLGSAQFTVYAPTKEYDELNNMSLIIKLTYGNSKFVFMGDTQKEREDDILAEGVDLSADVLKVGHHGSKTSTTQAFLNLVHPSYSVISVGAGNSYGLPDSETTRELEDVGIKIFRTDVSGTISMSSNGKNIQYKEEKSSGDIK